MAAPEGAKHPQHQQESRGAEEARARSTSPAGRAERADIDGADGRAEELKRRGRPVGFGFVTFESEEVAQHAVSTLDQTLCDGRQINVEVTSSRPRDRKPRGEGKPRRVRGLRRRGTENSKAESAPQESGEREPLEGCQAEKSANENGAEERPPRRPRARRERKPRNKAHDDESGEHHKEEGEGEQPAVAAEKQERRKRRQAHNRGRAPPGEEGGEAAAVEGQATNEGRPARAPRPPRPPRGPRAARRQKGPPSDRTIFVANLPFSMDSEQLEKLFAGFKAASVRVIQRRGSRRNKGFGFVEMVDHEEQTRAIDELRGDRALEVDGRVLSLSVALDEVVHSQEVNAEPFDPAPVRIDE
ncbi:MAG: hypothetical protein BJ554DRAFT_5258 [Olpidium bornovanus]|uniref:RRM domain-containing protein n=1 Tax=Olpidium bornovanus TaxID=278681 RepID=A0A8H8A2F1_9FUNG|nr:MAG: hypothetical protein BJ554DRAFT_5258 [Olpidium bornovanus]